MKAIGLVDVMIRKMKIVKIRMSSLCLIIFYFNTSFSPLSILPSSTISEEPSRP